MYIATFTEPGSSPYYWTGYSWAAFKRNAKWYYTSEAALVDVMTKMPARWKKNHRVVIIEVSRVQTR